MSGAKTLIKDLEQRKGESTNKGFVFEEPLRFDILVEGCLLLELKSVQEILPIHKAQLLSYMIQKRRGWASAAGEARECCAKSELDLDRRHKRATP